MRAAHVLAAALLLSLVAACGHVGPLAPPENGNGMSQDGDAGY